MVDPTCTTRRFWQRLSSTDRGWADDRNYEVADDDAGICRRLPPVGRRRDGPSEGLSALDAAMWAQWSVTVGDDDWCGEHRELTEEGSNVEA